MQGLEGTKLVQRVQGDPVDIFRERILLRQDLKSSVAHDARNRRRLRKALSKRLGETVRWS